MSEGNSITVFGGELSKPATVLIEKISDLLGGYFKPYQIVRVAKAEAQADEIRANAQVEITDIQRRALARFLHEEGRKQDNIERITGKAIPQLSDSSSPQKMDTDWIVNFFDKCRIISDDEMQLLWAKILAGEANSPGTYSKRTVNLLGSLDKSDAQLFTTLCAFAWFLEDLTPLIYDTRASIYKGQGVNFSALSHLDDIGLISFDPVGSLILEGLPKHVSFFYHNNHLSVELRSPENNTVPIGQVILTDTGDQLARICDPKPIDGFYDYIIEKWAAEGMVLSSPYPPSR